jgi:hypothetical protein
MAAQMNDMIAQTLIVHSIQRHHPKNVLTLSTLLN